MLDTAVHSQFVNYTDIVSRYPAQRVEAAFALAALMEIPEQYKVIMKATAIDDEKVFHQFLQCTGRQGTVWLVAQTSGFL